MSSFQEMNGTPRFSNARLCSIAVLPLLLLQFVQSVQSENASIAAIGDNTASVETKSPSKYALLIGINKYKNADIKPLLGARNDVAEMRKVLTSEFGFEARNIITLEDDAATKNAIIPAFKKQLVENARKDPKGLFVFQFSGHGSQVPDSDGDEPDGKDETLVPVDGTTSDAASQITDDELASLVNELTSLSNNVTMIFDTCHSGTVTRGDDDGSRSIEFTGSMTAKQKESLDKTNLREVLPASNKYVVISACLPNQTAKEYAPPGGKQANGLMTYWLLQALKSMKSSATFSDLKDRLLADVRNNGWQIPNIEGDLSRFILCDSSRRIDPYIRVTEVNPATGTTPQASPSSSSSNTSSNTNNTSISDVEIAAGLAQGVRTGSIIAFYKPETEKLTGDDPAQLISKGTVIKAENFNATVRLARALSAVEAKSAKAVVITPSFGTGECKLALSRDLPPVLITELKQKLSGDSHFQISETQTADLFNSSSTWDLCVLNDTKQNKYYISGRDKRPIFDARIAAGKGAAEQITKMLRNKIRQDNILALNNSVSPLSQMLEYRVVKAEKNSESWPSAQPVITKIGDEICIEVKNKSSKKLYITLISLDTDGGVSMLYPMQGSNEALLPDKSFVLPINIKMSGPAGANPFKLIATTKPVDYSFLQADGQTRSEISDPLAALLWRGCAWEGQTRGENKQQGEPALDNWATETISVLVTE